MLAPDEVRRLLDSIDVKTHAGLRDPALMLNSFARTGAALVMRAQDVFVRPPRLWVRLHEKGGKRHEMPLTKILSSMWRTISTLRLAPGSNRHAIPPDCARKRRNKRYAPVQANALAMVRRCLAASGIGTPIGNHSFRATGIATYLENGDTPETMANHSSTRTNQPYDRRPDEVPLDEVEPVSILGDRSRF